mmetsp:Transcript_45154/g.81576  ORF Transcript_45154/g.81576 Transcript_45154/m.81576 type:complete len:743 (+) Transcript_45154:185-2413(+)
MKQLMDVKHPLLDSVAGDPNIASTPSQQLVGRVEDVLAYGVRLRQCSWRDERAVCNPFAEFFLAPQHEVADEVLSAARANPYVSPARAGFRRPGSEIFVLFTPGSTGMFMAPTAEGRAEAVQLYTGRLAEGMEGVELCIAAAAPAPPVSLKAAAPGELILSDETQCFSTVDVASRWKCLGEARIEAGVWTDLPSVLDAWHQEACDAVKSHDGIAVCRTLRNCMKAIIDLPRHRQRARTAVPFMSKVLDELWVRQARGVEIRLRAIITLCIAHMDFFCPGVEELFFKREFIMVSRCIFTQMTGRPLGVGRLQWRRALSMCCKRRVDNTFPRKWRFPLPRISKRFCNTRNCPCRAWCSVHKGDHWGPPGPRCEKHGGRARCNVGSCTKAGAGKVREADVWGPAGHRCQQHGARRCIVKGCQTHAVVKATVADEHGPPGRRCWWHGIAYHPPRKRCNVPGCLQQPARCVKEDDKFGPVDRFGPVGFRCIKHHGAHYCAVPGCFRRCRKAVLKVDVADKFGPPGRRCTRHFSENVCGVQGCTNRSRAWAFVDNADHRGPPGPRCSDHSDATCGVRGCWRKPSGVVCKTDEHGKPGRRCRAHLKTPHTRLCDPKGGLWGDFSGIELLAQAKAEDARQKSNLVQRSNCKPKGRGKFSMEDAGPLGKISCVRIRNQPLGNEAAFFLCVCPGSKKLRVAVRCSRHDSPHWELIIETLHRYALQGKFNQQDMVKMKKAMIQRSFMTMGRSA